MSSFKIYILSFVVLLLVISCSDNTTNNNNNNGNKNYFILTANSWWVRDNYKLNIDGSRDLTTLKNDSLYITGIVTKVGQSCSRFLFYSDGTVTDSAFLYGSKTTQSSKYADKLYALPAYITPSSKDLGFDFPVQIPEEWVLIADLNGSTWAIYSTTLTNATVALPSLGDGKFTGSFAMEGAIGASNVNIVAPAGTFSCQEFKILYKINGNMVTFLGTIPINLTLTSHYYYADNKGLIKRQLDPAQIDIMGVTKMDIKGTEAIVTRLETFYAIE
jgi:hypothetical protein